MSDFDVHIVLNTKKKLTPSSLLLFLGSMFPNVRVRLKMISKMNSALFKTHKDTYIGFFHTLKILTLFAFSRGRSLENTAKIKSKTTFGTYYSIKISYFVSPIYISVIEISFFNLGENYINNEMIHRFYFRSP